MILATITSTISALVGLTVIITFFVNGRKAHDERVAKEALVIARLDSIQYQVNNNGGASMKDTVDSIWKSVRQLDTKIERHLGFHAALGELDQ
jgi:hypothetical protein